MMVAIGVGLAIGRCVPHQVLLVLNTNKIEDAKDRGNNGEFEEVGEECNELLIASVPVLVMMIVLLLLLLKISGTIITNEMGLAVCWG